MELTHLSLNGYRNLHPAEIDFSPGITVLWGRNAQGKTNLLEAVYLCSLGRSHRPLREQNLIQDGETQAFVGARVRHRDGIHTVEILLSEPRKKAIRVNGSPIRRMSELMGHTTAVIFSPEDLQLIREGPSARRRFLDSTLSQIYPSYCLQLQQYSRALASRNDLLRTILHHPEQKDMLFVWDEQLAEYGARLISARADFIRDVSGIAADIHSQISEGHEKLEVSYQPDVTGDEGELKQALLEALDKDRERDLRLLSTQSGPHRDDISVILDGNAAREQASQGQVRSCAITLKLAQMRWMKEQTGEMPILLLDDVYSELDRSRREMLRQALDGAQTILTCTDMDTAVLPHDGSAQILHMEQGQVFTY